MSTQVDGIQTNWEQFKRTKDRYAFQLLYTYYYQYLSFIGFKRGFDTNRVKDSINDVFLYLWEQADKLHTVENPHSYIITVFLQKLTRKEHFTSDTSVELEVAAEKLSEPSIESTYIQTQAQEELRELLAKHLQSLPTRQREVLYQKFYLGLSYAEIAAANHLSVHTVYNTVYQALEKLKAIVGSKAAELLNSSLALVALLLGLA